VIARLAEQAGSERGVAQMIAELSHEVVVLLVGLVNEVLICWMLICGG